MNLVEHIQKLNEENDWFQVDCLFRADLFAWWELKRIKQFAIIGYYYLNGQLYIRIIKK